jgi:putative oxidoreductase
VVFAEVFCAALVMLGLLTRLAAVPIVIFLGVAFFIQHAHDPWPQRELALLYLLPFLALIGTGAGRFSLDAGWAPWRRKGGKC